MNNNSNITLALQQIRGKGNQLNKFFKAVFKKIRFFIII